MDKQKIFIERANLRYGNKYDYSKSLYKGSQTPLSIICPEHGEFQQTPDVHLHAKHGCPECAHIIQNNKTRKKIGDLILKANKVHNDKYDYSKVNYINTITPVEIICPIHGSFYQSMDNHIRLKCGCSKCKGWSKTTEEWIKTAKKIHGNKYDYSKSIYINSKSKIEIICPKHGSFYQDNGCHIVLGHGCPECGKEKAALLAKQRGSKVDNNIFIKKAEKVHGNKYNYDKVNYINSNTKVEIICSKHGSFYQRPNSHLSGNGCRKCHESKGERLIRIYLENKSISFKDEYKFKNCKNTFQLRFDFYLPDYNTCIEFDGMQHFKPTSHFGGEAYFKITQKNDQIKNKYCKDNNIKLIRISYKQIDNINEILSKELVTKT